MTTDKAIILDTETHALEGNVIEVAYYPLDLSRGFLRNYRKDAFNQRFNPLVPIDLGAMGVHNIIDEDLVNCQPYNEFKLPSDIKYVIGHNIDYDVRAIHRSGPTQFLRPIDTLALARTLLPDAPNHKLATLSYYLATDRYKVRDYLRNAHSALTDVDLTTALLAKLIPMIPAEHTQSWETLYLYSLECRIPKVMPFGEHKGLEFNDVPYSYQTWLMKNKNIDVWLKLAFHLAEANVIRRTYELANNLVPDTYQDHHFVYTREPKEGSKLNLYEATLLNALRISNE